MSQPIRFNSDEEMTFWMEVYLLSLKEEGEGLRAADEALKALQERTGSNE